eukprot:350158-Chlamydomonas_euryale.AAC.6
MGRKKGGKTAGRLRDMRLRAARQQQDRRAGMRSAGKTGGRMGRKTVGKTGGRMGRKTVGKTGGRMGRKTAGKTGGRKGRLRMGRGKASSIQSREANGQRII